MTVIKSDKDGEIKQPARAATPPGETRSGPSAADNRQAPPRNQGPQQSNPVNRAPAARPAGQPDANRSGGTPNPVRRPEGPNQPARRPDAPRGPAATNPGSSANQGVRPDGTRVDPRRPGGPGGDPAGQPRRNDAPRGTGTGSSNSSVGSNNSSNSNNSGNRNAAGRPGGAPSTARPGAPPGGGSRSNGPRPAGSNNSNAHRRPQSHSGPQHSGGKGRPGPGASAQGGGLSDGLKTATPKADAAKVVTVTEVVIAPQITVRELAEKMHKSPIEVIKALMNYGIMVPITQTIDFGTAVVVGEDLGIAVKPEAIPEPEVVAEPKEAPRTLRQQIMAQEDPGALVERPPVVTVLGHVDHGKTTLLDAIRETRVVDGEAGGITQHIGAYQVERHGRKITFLDTPGHEAFTAMRARGASVTDIAVLVVAADDGVMPQTKEAIAHARAAEVPIMIALNKIDKANSNPDHVKQELAENGVLVEEYGGDVVCVPVSAKLRRGIDDLLESILLVYDVEPARANPGGECVGSVIESRLDKSRGPTATVLVQNGTLHPGDSILSGDTYGKVRAMFDDKGQPINEAPPSTPAVILGLDEVPSAGDTFKVVADERTARAIANERQAQKRADSNQPAPKALTLETIFAAVEAGQAKELNLILKADVQGSIEPIVNSLEKLSNDKVRVKILHQGTGNITESDVMLAVASKAIILGFSVTTDGTAQRQSESEGVDIRVYNIIYKLVEDVEKALVGMLEPVYREVTSGHAEVRQVFRITKVGKIAGCYVTDGEIPRNSMARIRRGGQVLQEDKITTLKRFQEDVAEVKTGYECGLNMANFNDFEVGDIIEAYKKERVS